MKYKLSSKAMTKGYRKIETKENLLELGFKEVGLEPVVIDDMIVIPTAYVIYKKIKENEKEKFIRG